MFVFFAFKKKSYLFKKMCLPRCVRDAAGRIGPQVDLRHHCHAGAPTRPSLKSHKNNNKCQTHCIALQSTGASQKKMLLARVQPAK